MVNLFERFYPCVPVSLQNFGISLYGLAWKRERLGGNFQQYVSEFRERDRWSPEQMQSHVESELRRVLRHAFDHVPYYQRAWRYAGVTTEDLKQMTVKELSRL